MKKYSFNYINNVLTNNLFSNKYKFYTYNGHVHNFYYMFRGEKLYEKGYFNMGMPYGHWLCDGKIKKYFL